MLAFVLYKYNKRKQFLHFFAAEDSGLTAQAMAAIHRAHDTNVSPDNIIMVKIIHEVQGTEDSSYKVLTLNTGYKAEVELSEVDTHRKAPLPKTTDQDHLCIDENEIDIWDRGLLKFKKLIRGFKGR